MVIRMSAMTLLLVEREYVLSQALTLAFDGRRDVRILGPVGDVEGVVGTRGVDVLIVDLTTHLAIIPPLVRRSPGTPILGWNPGGEGSAAAALSYGAVGLLPSVIEAEPILSAVSRAVAGELVLPDGHLRSLLADMRTDDLEHPRSWTLTPREHQVLALIAEGCATQDIAARLGISIGTVQSHVKSVLGKLGVHSKVEAVRVAWRDGLVSVPA
jgi:DNA-binding NarL/FixJ family response regulator